MSPPITEQDKQINYPDGAVVIQIRRANTTVITRPPIPQKNQQILHADNPVAIQIAGDRRLTDIPLGDVCRGLPSRGGEAAQ